METKSDFAPYLLSCRRRLDLTQETLGNAIGVDRNTVARWERGEVLPTHERLVRQALEFLVRTGEKK